MTQCSMFSERILACLKPPGAGDDTRLEVVPDALRCIETGDSYPFVDGVPSLFGRSDGDAGDVTTRVRSFYEENPFPSYEGLEEFGELVTKGNASGFANTLLRAIGYNNLVLECGCRTGQLSHYLQLNNNHVLGIDMSLSSLKLALEHKMRNQLERSGFVQMNIFDLAIKDASVDVVISHGVLHHTFDARRAFAAIVKKVRPGGIVVVGLYNRFGRIPTWLRAKLIGVFGPKIDYVVRTRIQDPRKADVWVQDQYFNPHETWHSIDEVLAWFGENDVEYLNCSPPILDSDAELKAGLFEKTDPGSKYQRIVTQLSWLATIAREGALFDVIGRRKA
jgi:SAM-dependent methyltransferase